MAEDASPDRHGDGDDEDETGHRDDDNNKDELDQPEEDPIQEKIAKII